MKNVTPKKTTVRAAGNGTVAVNNTGTEGRTVAVWRPSGRMVPKLTPEQIDHALDRIAAGDDPDQVAKSVGVTLQAFNKRSNDDPEFAKAYDEALAAGAEVDLSAAKRALIENEDARKLADMAMWRVEKVNRRYAAKSLISADNITIQVTRGVDDAWDSEEDQ